MDKVRIKSSSETDRLGLSGKVGHVYGFTTPSVIANVTRRRLEVIGALVEDFAVSVYFDDTGQQRWFSEQLLEYLDHDPSLEATIGGRRLFYTSDGRWQAAAGDSEPSSTEIEEK